MGEIQGYWLALLSLAILCAFVELFCPEGEGGGVARHMRLLVGLCLLSVLLQPLTHLLQNGSSLSDQLRDTLEDWLSESEGAKEDYRARWEAQSEQLDLSLACGLLEEMLAERFELTTDEITVSVQTDETTSQLEHLQIALRGRAIWVDTHAMEAFVLENFGCGCTIFLE